MHACRGLAEHGACLQAASSYSGMTAALLRRGCCVGLACQTHSHPLVRIAATVLCMMCNFGSPRRAECLAAVAAVVAACNGPVRCEVIEALKAVHLLQCESRFYHLQVACIQL